MSRKVYSITPEQADAIRSLAKQTGADSWLMVGSTGIFYDRHTRRPIGVKKAFSDLVDGATWEDITSIGPVAAMNVLWFASDVIGKRYETTR